MIDFDALVLGPAMDIFGMPIVIAPGKSQPGAAPYAARGVLRIENIDMPLEDGIASTQVITIGVRLSEFAIPPVPEDQVSTTTDTFWIDDTDEDGQGGSIWTMKRTAA